MTVSPAHVVLEAVQLSLDAKVEALQHLCASHEAILSLDLVLRILLTYLPECLEPSAYIPFLRALIEHNLDALDSSRDPAFSNRLSDSEVRRQVRHLHLVPLSSIRHLDGTPLDAPTCFLLDRAHRIDQETGSLLMVRQLLEPFIDSSEYLRTWMISTLLPLLRMNYESFPRITPINELDAFERLQGYSAVHALLPHSHEGNVVHKEMDEAQELRGLVGPWIYGENMRKRRKLGDVPNLPESEVARRQELEKEQSGWAYVNDWLLNTAQENFQQAAKTVARWGGPQDVDHGGWDHSGQESGALEARETLKNYAQAALATCYATSESSVDVFENTQMILGRVAELVGIDISNLHASVESSSALPPTKISSQFAHSLLPSHVYRESLLSQDNPVTRPNAEALRFGSLLLSTSRILKELGQSFELRSTLYLSTFSTINEQRATLRKIFHTLHSKNIQNDEVWLRIRKMLAWLRNMDNEDSSYGIFRDIGVMEIELELLRELLVASRYSLVMQIYCNERAIIIPLDQVEKAILDIALMSYDNASNGNKTRGGVKKASDLITTFRRFFPRSQVFGQTQALLLATHALSFYSLTLQHGVPFRPVNIRIQPEPLSLIEKVLDQNPRSYTKLEDLLDIGRNLVRADLIKPDDEDANSQKANPDDQILTVERQIIAKAIGAALAEEDFDTAYSYVVNRLSAANTMGSSHVASSAPVDDILWQAAFEAGRYRPKVSNGPSQLRRLEQRMELLSQSLLLAPPSSLKEVLASWRECEAELNQLLQEETEAEEKWDDRGDQKLPGQFEGDVANTFVQKARESTRNAMNEEAPRGLFDVARGAASAFSRSAFPLRDPKLAASTHGAKHSQQKDLTEHDSDSVSYDGEGRVRKRDIVSNMVTGSLVSGIGWVLGAPAARQDGMG